MGRRTDDLTIRAASVADNLDLARHFRLQAEAVLQYAVATEIVSEPDWPAYARDRLADPSTHILIAISAGKAIGSVELRLSHGAGHARTRRYGFRSALRSLIRRRLGSGPSQVVQKIGTRARIEHVFVEANSARPMLFRMLIRAAKAKAVTLNADILDADVAAADARLWRAYNSLRFENERVLVSMQLSTKK